MALAYLHQETRRIEKGDAAKYPMHNYPFAETEMEIYVEFRTRPWHEQINWNGLLGLAIMAAGSALGWAGIIAVFRALLR